MKQEVGAGANSVCDEMRIQRTSACGRGRAPRRAFTLIEMLIVMTILLILAGMVAVGARMAISHSKNGATKVLLAQLQAALDAKIEKFLRDTQSGQPIENYKWFAGAVSGDTVTSTNTLGQRAALLARLDAMRSAFPQAFVDIVPSQELMLAMGVDLNTSDTELPSTLSIDRFWEHTEHALSNLPAIGTNQPPLGLASAPMTYPYPTHQALFVEYLLASGQIPDKGAFASSGGYAGSWSSIPNQDPSGAARSYTLANGKQAGPHDPATESSECLYLILSDSTGGENAMASIGAQFIKDTDNDGLLEIVDSWGKPLRFYRSATDTFAYFMEVTQQYPNTSRAPIDLNQDGTLDPAADNSLDPNALLYEAALPTGSPGTAWWQLNAGTNFGPNGLTGGLKDVSECLFGRLHKAYKNSPSLGVAIADFNMKGNTGNGRNDSTNGNSPRVYPFRPLIVSAGPDGEFGMYDLNTQFPTADDGSTTAAIEYPQVHIGYRCGRVEEDEAKRINFKDNVFSVELNEGVKQ